jgi:uncharacterized membrane protein
LASFLASAVEMVEALTIVLAVGVTRGWPSVRLGALAALATLAVVVAVLGPSLSLMPIVVGGFLLIFGMQWLRKAILRASGITPLHDEEQAYRRGIELAQHAGPVHRTGVDWYAFTLSFKGVFLEGLEVAFIVLTFGSTPGGISVAATGATAALVLVGATGLLVHEPLSRVPENLMKFVVGLLLTTFGVFWGGEGVGIAWPGGDVALVLILALLTVSSAGLIKWLSGDRWRRPATLAAKSE